MKFFLKRKKEISLYLIIAFVLSLSPILVTKINAQSVNTANTSAGASLCASAGSADAAAVPIPTVAALTLGTGGWVDLHVVADYGTRYNTLQILCAELGVTPASAGFRQNTENSLFYLMMRVLLRQLTQSIVNWINSGFQGNPSFIQDPAKFLANDADQTVGAYLQSSDLKFLCEPFSINVKIALGLKYSPAEPPVGCRLTDALKNSKDAYNNFLNGDFINGGGWDSWLSVTTVPQNNQIGALMIAQDQLEVKIGDKALIRNNELNQGQGTLSLKKCTRTTDDGSGNVTTSSDYIGDPGFYKENVGSTSTRTTVDTSGSNEASVTTENCQITTPGTLISDQMKASWHWDVDALNMANDINEIVGALASFVITKAINKGYSLINPDELSPNNADWKNGLTSMQAQVATNNNNAIANPADPNLLNPDTYVSALTADNGGITYSGTASSTDGTLTAAQESLLKTLSFDKSQEQTYFNYFYSIYAGASTTVANFNSVIACYNSKLTQTSPALTSSQITVANTGIDQASTTIVQMNVIIASTTPVLAGSSANIAALNALSAQAASSTTMEILDATQNNLNILTPYLHASSTDITNAQSVASTTINGIIIPNLQVANTASTTCNAM